MSIRAHDTVSYGSLGILLGYLGGRGVDLGDFCARLRIPSEPPDNPDTRVTVGLMMRAWMLAYEVTNDSALALHVGADGSASALGIVGYLAAHSENVDQALRTVCRYFILISGGMSLAVAKEGSGAALVAESAGTPGGAWRFVVERTFAEAVSILAHETSGRGLPYRADFSFPAPAHARAFSRVICRDCRFESGRDALWFDGAALELRLARRHPRLRNLFSAEANHALGSLGRTDEISARLRGLIPDLMSRGLCGVRAAAQPLGVSERTLHRRLAGEGTSFQQILDEVRKDRCLRLLDENRLSMEQIAFACGFSEASGFFRAFKRWTGQAPSLYRPNRVLA